LDFVYKLIYWIIIGTCLIVPAVIISAISIVALLGMFIWFWLIKIKQLFVGFYTVPKDWFSIVFLNMFSPILSLFKKEQK
jgi:hypothetical protein